MRFYADEYYPKKIDGKSEAAHIVAGKIEDIKFSRNISITQATREAKLARILNYALSSEFLTADWNGNNAQPINVKSLEKAFVILQNLPRHLPLPEVIIEPTGEMGMDWCTDKGEFSASVDEKGFLSFACLLESGMETFGSGPIEDRFLPKNFLDTLSGIY